MLAEIKPTNKVNQPAALSPAFVSVWSSTAPAKITAGKPNKKENRADVSRFMPKNNPAVRVEPERETPGIRAKA